MNEDGDADYADNYGDDDEEEGLFPADDAFEDDEDADRANQYDNDEGVGLFHGGDALEEDGDSDHTDHGYVEQMRLLLVNDLEDRDSHTK